MVLKSNIEERPRRSETSLLWASVILHVVCVLVCNLQSKMIGGDPSVYKDMCRGETSRYDSPKTHLGVLEEDPTLNPQSCQNGVTYDQ